MDPDMVESTADRMIREAMEAGDFDDLPGTGRPIPGKGRVDDDMWWVRSWLDRNRHPDDQGSSNSE
ncbi:MAG TPA: DnaJ family domain-containing protein [Acidimicrobiia bacterium]